ncbi:hypothetical protein [Longimicrobium sp.]|uniref:hypothetical protein n=1 Tax=Longimicrobium sp. TaxID=2029185 RepID=UPI002E35D1B1|nr:hypothetical protein [Longimicrobium sp.]HEX6036617.1 hypothetical protein [Longimicrobium sp.]
MRLRSLLLAAPMMLALAACDGGPETPPEPTGGNFDALLQGPTSSESAALVELTGSGIEDVQSNGPAIVASSPVTGGRRVVVVRTAPGAIGFRVRVAPGNTAPTARVVELADADDQLRASLAGYQVTLTRAAAQ